VWGFISRYDTGFSVNFIKLAVKQGLFFVTILLYCSSDLLFLPLLNFSLANLDKKRFNTCFTRLWRVICGIGIVVYGLLS